MIYTRSMKFPDSWNDGMALGMLDVVSKRTESWLLFSVKGGGEKCKDFFLVVKT